MRWGRKTLTGVPEMAASHSASAATGRPACGLRLESVDLADGSQPDTDFRSAVAGPRVLRGNHPRQPGSGPPGSRATGLRPGGDEENAGRVSNPGDSGRCASEPAYQLQELRSEAVLQRRAWLPDRRDFPQPP